MLTSASKIQGIPARGPVRRAAKALLRDISRTCTPGAEQGMDVVLTETIMPPEQYLIRKEGQTLRLCAGDALGFIYGLYRISHDILGVEPFWFWNDQPLHKAEGYPVPAGWTAVSKPCAVRYRGWFINDEVLLDAWYLDGSKDKPWEMAFEALLRLGGNLVIPGTDRNGHKYDTLAADFGLYITHHHAEPLGARMFLRAYPDLKPSYDEHPDLFEGLWQEAVDKQKSRPTVYNLGFRGQGDCPFWANDPRYDTPETRGALMSELIRKQYDLVKSSIPDAPCCTNLYGETMELYQQGHLNLPENVIKIWADNGFGKMVTRRQGNHNPRIRALPKEGASGAHGLYYHASFYDLQAASQMTMLPNPPEFVRRELAEALSLGVKDYWIINCSNVKPHVYTLDLIAALWRDGNVDTEQHLLDYCACYYGTGNAELAAKCFRAWYDNALFYGAHEDERAGEQFANHCARMLVSRWMKNPAVPAPDMKWAIDAPTLKAQVEWYRAKCVQGVENYTCVLRACQRAMLDMIEPGATLMMDTIAMQSELLQKTYQGSVHAMDSLLHAMQEDWLNAFYLAGKAKAVYLAADRVMRDREHGKWHLYYANDCQADVKQSAWLMGVLMGVLRNNGDGPHFYQWQRRFLDAPEDAQIMLILNMENHLDNDELFALMDARWEE